MKNYLNIGIDVGSTTTKIAILNGEELIFCRYIRHFARQRDSILELLKAAAETLDKKATASICLTGSGARTLAERLELPFTQEVVANSMALRRFYGKIGTAIELGGQDAKIIFFRDNDEGKPEVFDMRMNGSCAGGTGAFIDEVATVLDIEVTEMNSLSEKGSGLYDISGRCGVFAKTDIQALLNQGVSKADIALSGYHAIAKQTIGGLSQGLKICPPVAFEGGPFTFHPMLREVFKERLGLSNEDVLIPERPEMMVAYGAALSLKEIHADNKPVAIDHLINLFNGLTEEELENEPEQLFFENNEDRKHFNSRHAIKEVKSYSPRQGETVNAYLGIDAGSTTTKLVLLNVKEEIIDSFYASNEGSPIKVAQRALLSIFESE